MSETAKKPELSTLLGKTYSFNWSLPNPGTNTRSQQGEMGVTVMRATSKPMKIGFYEVADPLTGIVNGLKPSEFGYEAAALAEATNNNLMLSDNLIGKGSRKAQTSKLDAMNPSKTYGMILGGLLETNQIFTSYSAPTDEMLYPFQSFLIGQNRVAIGIEATPFSSRGDYADLIMTLPDNIFMRNTGQS